MNKKEILKALYSKEEIDLLTNCIVEVEIDWCDGFEMLVKEDQESFKALMHHPNTIGRIMYMGERRNILHAQLVRNYYKEVLGRNAVMFFDLADPQSSDGWHGYGVWVEGGQ